VIFPNERKIFVNKQLNLKNRINSWVAEQDGVFYAEVAHAFKANLNGSLGESTFFKEIGPSARDVRSSIAIQYVF
jgi:hypothetical protein